MRALRRVNRKRNNGFLFPPQLALVFALLAIFALGYLGLCSRCEGLNREVKRIEENRAELRRRVVNEQYKWANQTSLSRIEAKLAEFKLDMSFPPSSRIVHLDHPVQLADLDPDEAWSKQVVRLSDRDPAIFHD